MCGIAGVRRFGSEPITDAQISLLLVGLEHRGNDATGLVLQQADGSLHILKKDVPAWQFVGSDYFREFTAKHLTAETIIALLHTRAATRGSPRNPDNNHPISAGVSAIIHNGVIQNDRELFSRYDLTRSAETDSDIFRAIIDANGITDTAIERLNEVRGSAALAAVDRRYPGKLLLARSGSPITIGSTPDHFVFASEKNIIHRAMRPWVDRWGIAFQVQSLQMAFSPFPDDTAWILGPDGKELHRKFDTLQSTYQPPNYRVNADYGRRQARWDAKATSKAPSACTAMKSLLPEHVRCVPCNKALYLTAKQRKGQLHEACCPKCGGSLVVAS